MNWQPIETAPKDGTRILVNDGCDCFVAWWDNYYKEFVIGSYCDDNGGDLIEVNKIVEWQPLPEIENE